MFAVYFRERRRRFKRCCRKALWDSIISFPLIKDWPGAPYAKGDKKGSIEASFLGI